MEYSEEKVETVRIECVDCHKVYSFEINPQDYIDWQRGKLIQQAFPYLPPGKRELIKSQICDACWDKLFNIDEEE